MTSIETTRDDRIRIAVLHEVAKLTFKTIVEKLDLDIDVSTCSRIYQRMKIDGTPNNRKRTGRPQYFSEGQIQDLDNYIIQDKRTRQLPWCKVRDEMG